MQPTLANIRQTCNEHAISIYVRHLDTVATHINRLPAHL